MFNSRSRKYRNPTGAVADGQGVHFRVTLDRPLSCTSAHLVIQPEGGEALVWDMFWCGMNGENREWWECEFTPEKPGLYFYHFEIHTCRGILTIYRGEGGTGVFGGTNQWQMTVYDHRFTTPSWLLGGIMYQILPDRFARSDSPKGEIPYGRSFHTNWHEQPEWRPNEQGEVTNSDFFGGDLRGIQDALPYLKELGVTCLYLNPIFESHSNHRYDTADYSKIDPLLGTEEDFKELCQRAKEQGIRIILDGVFSHTGSDSLYFNKSGRYGTEGAYQSQDSPYAPWYSFYKWPDGYDCWWNFNTLPNVQETNESFNAYINGSGGIVPKWLRAGASGWRLDVADELPDLFLDRLAAAAKEEKEDALVLGEVWEDASNKSAYGVRRRYLLGGQLDTVMNYPFRDAVLGFMLGADPREFKEIVENIVENYPPQCLHLLMNHLGTHDTERILTMLGGEPAGGRGREWQAAQRLTEEQRTLALQRLRLASLIQYLLPGVPCIYYGDEAGIEGYRDPFCRACFPWGREDKDLIEWYKGLGRMRLANRDILAEGSYRTLRAENNLLVFERYIFTETTRESLLLVANRSGRPQSIKGLGLDFTGAVPVLGSHLGTVQVVLPYSGSVMRFSRRLPPPREEPPVQEE